MSDAWQALVRRPLRGAGAYDVPSHPNAVKLDANELPYAWSGAAQRALGQALTQAALHRYPDASARALRQLLATQLGIDVEELLLGNGSDELIALLCAAFAEPRPGRIQGGVAYAVPGFVVYRTAALAQGLEPVEVPFGPDFAPDEAALLAAVAARRPNLLFLATPNNPTGTVWPRAVVETLLARHPDMLTIVDEAYLAYGEASSCIDLTRAYPHCLVLQTLSKVGMAGLRVGLLIGQRAVLAAVEKIRPPYNINTLSQTAAHLLLRDFRPELEAHVAEVKRERQRLFEALRQLPGLTVFPSGGNFFLVRVAKARRLHAALVDRGVLVRLFDAGPLSGCLRITVGTPDENAWLVDALRASLG